MDCQRGTKRKRNVCTDHVEAHRAAPLLDQLDDALAKLVALLLTRGTPEGQ